MCYCVSSVFIPLVLRRFSFIISGVLSGTSLLLDTLLTISQVLLEEFLQSTCFLYVYLSICLSFVHFSYSSNCYFIFVKFFLFIFKNSTYVTDLIFYVVLLRLSSELFRILSYLSFYLVTFSRYVFWFCFFFNSSFFQMSLIFCSSSPFFNYLILKVFVLSFLRSFDKFIYYRLLKDIDPFPCL